MASARPFRSIQEGLEALSNNQINAFVADEAILKYLVKTDYPAQLKVLGETFNHYYVGMVMPTNSPLREPVNRALLNIMAKEKWDRVLVRHLGSGG